MMWFIFYFPFSFLQAQRCKQTEDSVCHGLGNRKHLSRGAGSAVALLHLRSTALLGFFLPPPVLFFFWLFC